MKTKLWIGLTAALITAGCASTSIITNSWKADNVAAKKYNKILVLGIIRDSDRGLREKMENHFVGDLKDLGYDAVSSLKEYGPNAFNNMDEESAVNKIKYSGMDAVITIVLLDRKKERNYVPGYMHFSPYGYYYNRFWGYHSTLYRRIYESGYYVNESKYFWESNFYDMSDQKLIYSVHTNSFDPVNTESMAHEYGRMIVKNMVKQSVLKNQNNPMASSSSPGAH